MRVDVHLGDSELALLAGYNRSTTMGIKKPGELQRELLSNMENIEEKRMLTVPEVKSGFPEVVSEAHEVPEESESNVTGGIRADLLSKLSELAPVEDNSDETGSDVLSKDGEGEAPSESEENVGVLPDDEEDTWEEGDSTLPDDEEDWEEGDSTLSDDEEDWEEGSAVTLSVDEDSVEEETEAPSDDDGTFGEGVGSEEDTTGISSDEGYSNELPEDSEYSEELPEDEDSEYSEELPEDEDEELPEDDEDSGYPEELPEDEDEELPEDEDEELPEDEDEELPEDEDEDTGYFEELPEDDDEEPEELLEDVASGYPEELPEDDEDEVEASKGISASVQEVNESASSRVAISDVVEKPAPSLHRSREPMPKHTTSHPTGCSAPPVSLYDFILNNGGSMLIEDVRKCYPVDEVKKALNLGKIYRFGNKVGV